MKSSSTSRAERILARAPLAAAGALIAAPLLALMTQVSWRSAPELIGHLAATVLPMHLGYSLLVAAGAALAATALSVGGLACAAFNFPARSLLARLLLIPLLAPPWFLAVLLRETWGADAAPGLILVLAVSSAPIVHLLGSAAIRALPPEYGEVLRLAGRGAPGSLIRTLAPLVLSSLVAAAGIVALLAFTDAACARTMAVPTLAVGVLDQWFGREDASVGALLGLVSTGFGMVLAAVLWSRFAQSAWYDSARVSGRPWTRVPLKGWRGAVPWLLSAPQLVAGVVVPAIVTGLWASQRLDRVNLAFLGSDIFRTLVAGTAGTLLALLVALPLLHAVSTLQAHKPSAWLALISVPAFALSPAVLALAVFRLTASSGSTGPAAWVQGTILPLIGAWAVRFAPVFVAAGHATLVRKAHSHLDWMRLAGRAQLGSFLRLLGPVLARPLSVAGAFVFLETLKDAVLPLVLQPFGFDTISTRVFQYAQTQRVRDCAVWILCLALIGAWPLFTLARAAEAGSEESA